MKKTITIENLTNRSRTFNLPHAEVCSQSQVCHCVGGKPASLFIPANGTLKGLDESVRFSGEIKAAANMRPRPVIKITTIDPVKAKKKAAPKSTEGGHGGISETIPPQGKDHGTGKKKKRG